MDNKPSRSPDSFDADNGDIELRRNFLNSSLHKSYGLLRILNNNPDKVWIDPLDGKDALEAVKLDPAVLEAQVTMLAKDETKDKIKDTDQESFIEAKQDIQTEVPQSQAKRGYEDMMSQSEQAFLSLTPNQLNMLLQYTDMLRRQRANTQKYLECGFCKNNGRSPYRYIPHALKDDNGRVTCPVLRRYRCPRCGATGDQAHTIKYCPNNLFIDTQSMCSF